MPGDSTTSPPPGPVEEADFSDLLDDDEPAEEVTATGLAAASVAAAAMAMGATTTEERPTLVPEIDLQALAKLGPEAFAHRQGLPADLLALSTSLGTAGVENPSTTPTHTQLPAQQVPERARSEMPSPIPTPVAMPAVVVPPAAKALSELDMFELDPVSLAFDEEKRRSVAPAGPTEDERPTSRPPVGEGPPSMRPNAPTAATGAAGSAGSTVSPAPPAPAPAAASVVRAQTVDDFFNDLDDPSEIHPMTEPPGEASPTEIPPEKSVDEMFADMIDEPFPPSFVPSAQASASEDAEAEATAPHVALTELDDLPIHDLPSDDVPIDELSSDEIFDADADEAMADLRARFAANDFPGALHLAEPLANDMLHAAEVAEIIAACQAAMQARYVERIGSLTKVPIISVPMSVILELPIDNRAGFLLSRIDGVSSLEMILDMCGMSELDALRIVYDLVQNGALDFI